MPYAPTGTATPSATYRLLNPFFQPPEPQDDLILGLLHVDLAVDKLPEGGLRRLLVERGPPRTAPVLEDDHAIVVLDVLLIREGVGVLREKPREALEQRLGSDLLEPERDELPQEVLPRPRPEGAGLLIRQVVHEFREIGRASCRERVDMGGSGG